METAASYWIQILILLRPWHLNKYCYCLKCSLVVYHLSEPKIIYLGVLIAN